MGGFLGIGNSSAKTDRGNQLAGVSADWNVYNRGLPAYDTGAKAGEATLDKSLGSLDDIKNQWRDLTQPDRTALTSQAAPIVNATVDQGDAVKREQANMGTARGGGAGSVNQQVQSEEMKSIDDTIAKTANTDRTAGMQGQQSVATAEAGIGHEQMAQALQSLGLSADVAREIIDSSITSRPISMKANAAVTQSWSNALGALGL